jgi:dolichol-phosphate mannosyltransferase
LIRDSIRLLRNSLFVRYCIVGVTGTLIDTAILYLLSDPHTLNWGLTRSKIVGAELALLNNFIWNDIWTFGKYSSGKHGFWQKMRRFLRFNLICTAGILFNLILLNIGFNWLHMNRYIANLAAILLVTLWNYNVNRRLSWRTHSEELEITP